MNCDWIVIVVEWCKIFVGFEQIYSEGEVVIFIYDKKVKLLVVF